MTFEEWYFKEYGGKPDPRIDHDCYALGDAWDAAYRAALEEAAQEAEAKAKLSNDIPWVLIAAWLRAKEE